jgi:hypothetical protein
VPTSPAFRRATTADGPTSVPTSQPIAAHGTSPDAKPDFFSTPVGAQPTSSGAAAGAEPTSSGAGVGAEPTSFGALGELVRRVEQLSESTSAAIGPTAAIATPTASATVDDPLDRLEEALEVLIRRDAERYGITGWSA